MKTPITEKQRQFILDTLLPYKEDKLKCAFEDGDCKYITLKNKMCAVGKHMNKGVWQQSRQNIESLSEKYELESMLNKEAIDMNFSIYLWRNIQKYHDAIAVGNATGVALDYIETGTGVQFPELRFT